MLQIFSSRPLSTYLHVVQEKCCLAMIRRKKLKRDTCSPKEREVDFCARRQNFLQLFSWAGDTEKRVRQLLLHIHREFASSFDPPLLRLPRLPLHFQLLLLLILLLLVLLLLQCCYTFAAGLLSLRHCHCCCVCSTR